MGDLIFVTGGSRSGKSAFAERLVGRLTEPWDTPVVYVATLEPLDSEMTARIERHAARRLPEWRTVEAPHALAMAIVAAPCTDALLVDSLSGWVSNRLLALGDDTPTLDAIASLEAALRAEVTTIVARAAEREAPTVIVSDEVGSGLVPEYALGRAYRDVLSAANEAVSRAANDAWLVVAGRALALPPPA